jgi:hypothetical protein
MFCESHQETTLKRYYQGHESMLDHFVSIVDPWISPIFSDLITSYGFSRVALELFAFMISNAECT